MPASTTVSVVIVSGVLGLLRKGLPTVRITNNMSVCVSQN
jgi:hypothetical protein